MQDRYVGDVGDFGKYALLKRLATGDGRRRLRLGVVWCRYPDEGHNGDGRHVSYLDKPSFASLDPALYGALTTLVRAGKRTIVDVERSAVLPDGTDFFGEVTTGVSGHGTVSARRQAYRSSWVLRAMEATRDADLVFLDPDNGIASPATARGGPKAGKYVFADEIAGFWGRGQSLVVYHHLNRLATNGVQVSTLSGRIVDVIGRPALMCPLVLRRGSCRVFWIVGQPDHAETLRAGVEAFVAGGWHAHCDVSYS